MGSHAGSLQEAHLGCLHSLGECQSCQLGNSFVSPLQGFISWTLFTSTTLMRLVCKARMLAYYLITDQLLLGLAQQGSWLSWLHGSAIQSSLSGWEWLALGAEGSSPLTYSPESLGIFQPHLHITVLIGFSNLTSGRGLLLTLVFSLWRCSAYDQSYFRRVYRKSQMCMTIGRWEMIII